MKKLKALIAVGAAVTMLGSAAPVEAQGGALSGALGGAVGPATAVGLVVIGGIAIGATVTSSSGTAHAHG